MLVNSYFGFVKGIRLDGQLLERCVAYDLEESCAHILQQDAYRHPLRNDDGYPTIVVYGKITLEVLNA